MILETSFYLRALGHVEVRVKRFGEKTECGDVLLCTGSLITWTVSEGEKKSCHVHKRFHVVSGN